MGASYVLGIDLGTTNSVVAYAPLGGEQPQIELLPIPQLVAAGTVEARRSLPSFLYLPPPAASAAELPWGRAESVVGELARRQSAEQPERTVSAAKSWLSHSRVDRHQPILPWNAPEEVPKVSPVEAARRCLEHLVAAWQHQFPEAAVAEQRVVLTVPASFDAAARELTREAAVAAGLPDDLVLLEEPQAAVYCWVAMLGDRWRRRLTVGDRLLVADIGGGTTDLTLVRVTQAAGQLELERVAVGNHLLVGGDNMDLALAHHVAARFADQGLVLDPWQSVALWHSCRTAKEMLLGEDGPPVYPVSVLGRGSKLIGGTISVDVEREQVAELLIDGFFPVCRATDRPVRQRTSGFQEIGLAFETDTRVTRHVAQFLASHAEQPGVPVQPTHVLFNGGVFKAGRLQRRLLEVLGQWSEGQGGPIPRPLEAPRQELDHAVALGAAYYGWAAQHGGVRIRGGTARSYYVGVETSAPAVPGAPRPLQALCVVPFGMEEGSEADVPSGEIGLVVGEPAQFRFFSSAVRKQDAVGQLLRAWGEGELVETDPLETTLAADATAEDQTYVPVRFRSRITELGMFELWCVSTLDDHRWKLEFSVRDSDEP